MWGAFDTVLCGWCENFPTYFYLARAHFPFEDSFQVSENSPKTSALFSNNPFLARYRGPNPLLASSIAWERINGG